MQTSSPRNGKQIIRGRQHIALRMAAVTCLCLAGTAAHALPTDPVDTLLPHRAVYELSLLERQRDSGVEDAAGLYIFDVTGNACLGWSMASDMILSIRGVSGGTVRTQTQYRAFEEGSGALFTFETRTDTDNEDPILVTGAAERADDGTLSIQHLTDGAESTEMDGQAAAETLLPSQLTRALLSAASDGEHLFFSTVFDGSHDAGLAQPASAIIGAPVAPTVVAPFGDRAALGQGDMQPDLRDDIPLPANAWPIRLSYFDPREPDSGPDFEIEFVLDTNGVADQLVLDYGAFTLRGTLASLDAYVSEPCAD